MAKIYTKTGDRGETSLVGGTRVSKGSEIVELYGEVDELNSFMGLAISSASETEIGVDYLYFLQSRLFDIGSTLACEISKRSSLGLRPIDESVLKEMEEKIDVLCEKLPKINQFILPGGSEASSLFHICRAIGRRVERSLVRVGQNEPELVEENMLKFFNRLSDFFFVMARRQAQFHGVERFWSKR